MGTRANITIITVDGDKTSYYKNSSMDVHTVTAKVMQALRFPNDFHVVLKSGLGLEKEIDITAHCAVMFEISYIIDFRDDRFLFQEETSEADVELSQEGLQSILDDLHRAEIQFSDEPITKNFAQLVAGGEANPEELDDFVGKWHDGEGRNQELHEYLGLKWEEYAVIVKQPSKTREILAKRTPLEAV